MNMTKGLCVAAAGLAAACALPVHAQDVITTHRLSAALASEAVAEAVASCTKQGYKESAVVVDMDGVEQALLRGDGASVLTIDAARDKAYTAATLGANRGESSGDVAKRFASGSPAGLAKLPHVVLAQGGLLIKVGTEVVAAIGAGGAPGGDLDDACAKAGIDKISDRLK
jgi:uncharacterized protein GlcG (DUF336 family)